jgi:hypothetical protein
MKAAKSCLVVLLFILAGCATQAPVPPINAQKLATIKRIAIAAPTTSQYFASVGAAPVTNFANGGLGVNAASGVVSGLLTSVSQSRASGFDSLVKSRLPALDLNREFVERLGAELTAQGYVVTEVELGKAGAPIVTRDNGARTYSIRGNGYADADAILWVPIVTAYFAPGPLNAYKRSVSADAHLFARTDELIAHQYFGFQKAFSDDYSYNTYNGLTEDLDRAMDGLREALLGLVPEICKMLKPNTQSGS